MKINIEEIAIKVKVVEQKKLQAIVSLDFGDFVVKGFRIMSSEFENCNGDKLWVTPPSYPGVGGKYHPIFYIPNKELWQALEKRIWEEYKKQSEEHHKKRFDIGDNDIPIIVN